MLYVLRKKETSDVSKEWIFLAITKLSFDRLKGSHWLRKEQDLLNYFDFYLIVDEIIFKMYKSALPNFVN